VGQAFSNCAPRKRLKFATKISIYFLQFIEYSLYMPLHAFHLIISRLNIYSIVTISGKYTF